MMGKMERNSNNKRRDMIEDDWELVSEREGFKCPKCGSSYWGHGSCHDQFNQRCTFSFPAEDYDKYVRLTRIYKPKE